MKGTLWVAALLAVMSSDKAVACSVVEMPVPVVIDGDTFVFDTFSCRWVKAKRLPHGWPYIPGLTNKDKVSPALQPWITHAPLLQLPFAQAKQRAIGSGGWQP